MSKHKQWHIPILFLLPAFVLLAIFRYYPLFSSIYHSFTAWNISSSRFVGFQNYINLFHDSFFIASIQNILIYVLVTLIAIMVMAVVGAELVFNSPSKMVTIWKYLFIVPMVVPYTVGLMIWSFIYNPYLGILNQFLNAIGLSNFALPWLGSSQTALYAVAFVGFPFLSSLQFLIVLSSLQSIDTSILDAAKIDGATTLRRILRVDLPMISDKLFLAAMLTVIGSFQAFTQFFILTGGGPGTSSMVPGLYLYFSAFQRNALGYACAIGVIMAVISLAVILITQKIEQKVTPI